MDDSGILALVVLAQFHQIAVDPDRIRHEFGNPGTPFTPENILRAAKTLGFRARKVDSSLDRLSSAILPAIGIDTQGTFFIIAKVARDAHMWLLHDEAPHYAWARNKGYASAEHRAAIRSLGLSQHHRASWAIADAPCARRP